MHRARTRKEVIADLDYLYKYACKLYREGHSNEVFIITKNLVRLAFKNRLGSYAFKLVCRKCMIPIIPGLTTSFRIKRRSGKSYILIRCNNCNYARKKIFKHKGVEKRVSKRYQKRYMEDQT